MRLETGDRRWSLTAGRAALIAAGTDVAVTVLRPVTAASVLFDAPPSAQVRGVTVFDLSPLARELIAALGRSGDAAFAAAMEAAFAAEVARLARTPFPCFVPMPGKTAVRRLIDIAEGRLEAVPSFDHLAREVGRSPRALSRDVAESVGMTWPQLLRVMRVVRATELLTGTDDSITAIALTPLSSASAILQATPLVVTLGAALFLGEQVGWRRWSAILVGFAGVILIIRPGFDAFEPASLFAVMGVVGLALRDLATRTVPRSISSMQLSTYAFLTLVPAGIGMLAFTGDAPRVLNGLEWLLIAAALAFGVLSYYAIVAAMRMGDVAVITPFRYSRLVFALCFGVLFFGERPDMATLAGSALIVASGIYTFWREARLRRNAARTAKG